MGIFGFLDASRKAASGVLARTSVGPSTFVSPQAGTTKTGAPPLVVSRPPSGGGTSTPTVTSPATGGSQGAGVVGSFGGLTDGFGLGFGSIQNDAVTSPISAGGTANSDPSDEQNPIEGILGQLMDKAKASGMDLAAYLDGWVRANPALAAALGVTSGAALVALLGAAVKTKTAKKKTSTTKKKKKTSTSRKKTTRSRSSRGRKARPFSSSEVKRVNREARRLQRDHKGWSWKTALKAAWHDERD